MRRQHVVRLAAREHVVEHGVAPNREVAGGGMRRDGQDDERGDEDRRGFAARVDDGEDAQAEQRRVEREDREQQPQVERGMREHERAGREHDRERQREQDGARRYAPTKSCPSPGTNIDSVAAAIERSVGAGRDARAERATSDGP